jgi:hypothetical protein
LVCAALGRVLGRRDTRDVAHARYGEARMKNGVMSIAGSSCPNTARYAASTRSTDVVSVRREPISRSAQSGSDVANGAHGCAHQHGWA